MKIALTSTEAELTATIDPRFGRCAYFIVVDLDGTHFETFPNENKDLSTGAGIQSATFIASKGVQAVITGNCGPNAIQVLSTAGVDLYTGEAGKTVAESIERFKNSSLLSSKVKEPSNQNVNRQDNTVRRNPGQFIPSDSSGRGMGMGGGRGMGGGGGRGMGGCGGRGMGGCGGRGGRGMGGGGGRGTR